MHLRGKGTQEKGRGRRLRTSPSLNRKSYTGRILPHNSIAGKPSSWFKSGMVEHKGTENQYHIPSCSETVHKERLAGGHDIGWWRFKLPSLCGGPLKMGQKTFSEWWHSLSYLTSLVCSSQIFKNCHEDTMFVK